MSEPEQHVFSPDVAIPNSRFPLLVYRGAVPADAAAIERRFAANGWSNGWRDGIFPFHHFHSNAHEVLGIAAGNAKVWFGGPKGTEVAVQAGDVVVIPAGVGHRCDEASGDLLVVGAYPGGADHDTRRIDPLRAEQYLEAAAAVPVPASDPLTGPGGPLPGLWHQALEADHAAATTEHAMAHGRGEPSRGSHGPMPRLWR
jgi:uncharacterized protein YjlB